MTGLPDTIRTARLTLRRPRLADLQAWTRYYGSRRARHSGGPIDARAAAARFHATAGQWALRGYGRHVIERREGAGEGIGHVGPLHLFEADGPGMAWTLWDVRHEGEGLATEAAAAVLSAWDGPPLVAHVAADNAASHRVAERLGMRRDPEAEPPHWDATAVTYRQAA